MMLAEMDLGALVWLVLIGLSALGGIFGKKKEQQETKRRQEQQREQTDASPPRPRMAPPPTPPRAPSGSVLQPPPKPPRPPVARPSRPTQPPIVARPSTPQSSRPWVIPPPEPAGELEPVFVELEPDSELQQASPVTPKLTPAVLPTGKPAAATVGGCLSDVRGLLRQKSGLRSALILTEILAQPVGLRDNSPDSP